MCATGWSLLPPLLSIALVLFTKEIYFSLCVGILTGALFATGFNPIATMNLIVVDGLSASVAALAGNFCFLVFLGALIHLLTISGGGAAFGRWSEKHIHSRRGVQFATFLLGILIFIDDYFNCLTVGSVMQSVTDRQKISRAKLAYLIDATAVPSVLSCQFHLGRRLFLA